MTGMYMCACMYIQMCMYMSLYLLPLDNYGSPHMQNFSFVFIKNKKEYND